MKYVSVDKYIEKYNHLEEIDNEIIQLLLDEACNDIDILTFNRIKAKGFENLSDFQKEQLFIVICELMEFQYNNRDFLTNVFSSYEVNGTSFDMGNKNYTIISGVPILRNIYKKLEQTGLTYRGGRY